MTRTLETTLEECLRAKACIKPGWFESALILDACSAHEMLAVIREIRDGSTTIERAWELCGPWLEGS